MNEKQNGKQKEALVKELYEKYPYPARKNITKEGAIYFARWAADSFDSDATYWKGKEVLELGCGTGELDCGLALSGARVIAVDFSSSSIKNAKALAKRLGADGKVTFLCKNILELNGDEFGKKFDAVIALGSLHHTIDAKKGFEIACANLKNEGIIVIGLYNKYARFRHRLKRFLLWSFCGADIEKRILFGEKHFGKNIKAGKAWLADKYGQVHESYHSVSEIKEWFKENGIEFVSSKPKLKIARIGEIKWLLKKKGAFFVMTGIKSATKYLFTAD
ncbi:Ubiquinone biosynthesis O-methyltransferase [uncultured archaeon]|nr:Ubiquinone biosynthesis O-methyltransferase [uncultured archaeon]